jgi:formylglycine-generating enzyme required for sulfatase activity
MFIYRSRCRQTAFIVGLGFLLHLGSVGCRPVAAAAQDGSLGRKLAFLVGVKAYDHSDLKNLDFPENDVEELASVLNRDGFQTVVLTTTRGQKDERGKPTAQNIRNELKSLLQGATKQDLVVVGLAGHGIQPLGSDQSYFCPADANPVIKDNRPIQPERLVSVGELLTEMSDSGIGLKLLLVDACRNDPTARNVSRRGLNHVSVTALPVQTSVLLSCSQGEFSFEDKSLGRGHGVFFYHVIQGLKGAAKDRDGLVTWDGLELYVRTKVPSTVERLYGKDGGEQSPNAIGNLRGVPTTLARIVSGRIKTPPAPDGSERPTRVNRRLGEMPIALASISSVGFQTPLQQEGGEPAPLIAPFNHRKALAARLAWAQYQQLEEGRTNSVGMDLILIPPGEFQMGSEETYSQLVQRFPSIRETAERSRTVRTLLSSAQPRHKMRISTPFYLGACEVTKGQFRQFVDMTHYKTDAERHLKGGWGYTGKQFVQSRAFTWRDCGVDQSDNFPVVNVSWNDAVRFCGWLSHKEGKKYRLPTEAEWEYACRAGTVGRYYNGNDPEMLTQIGNVRDAAAIQELATRKDGVNSSDAWAFTSPVGQFRPNNFGLYDMLGNAQEWCHDWWNESYYRESPASDPTGSPNGQFRVTRGGGWSDGAVYRRAAQRGRAAPTHRSTHIGFRIACER